MPKKKAAPKKSVKKTTRRTTSSKSSARSSVRDKSLLQQYLEHREHFFRTHKNAQWLLAIFIIAVAVYVAILIRVDFLVDVSEAMAAEGLPYDAKLIPFLGF